MPVIVLKRRGRYRVVEADTRRIAKTKNNKARDGGGHRSKKKAERQARAINAATSRRR